VLAIGRTLVFKSIGDPAQVPQELSRLQSSPRRGAYTPVPEGGSAVSSGDIILSEQGGALPGGDAALSAGADFPVSPLQQLTQISPNGELEVAVSNDGRDIVVARQNVFQTSNDGGQTFPFSGFLPINDGDGSLAFGQSGNFYFAGLFPPGCPANSNCIAIAPLTNRGQILGTLVNAVVCPNSGMGACSVDQEHIAADRVNAATGSADRVYMVFRDLIGNANITCSPDSAANWAPRLPLEGGSDFPRITVGQDGFVYAVFRNGGNIRIDKFNPCTSSTVVMTRAPGGFPRTVSAFNDVAGCGVLSSPMNPGGFAGLDRCNNGNILSSPMVAVDDTVPTHIYVAFATNTSPTDERIQVADSIDGGVNWRTPVTVNTNVPARRFLPWICTTGGDAFVTWYDRRAATPCPSPPCAASNDLTDYFAASAGLDPAGNLVANNDEFRISMVSDKQCDAGRWPCAPRFQSDSENCSTQPQLAGQCSITTAIRCDFPDCAGGGGVGACQCPAIGETCNTGGGCPSYGDYNGNACAVGRLFAVFASASETGLANAPINNFFQAFLVAAVPEIQVPSSLLFADTCVGGTSFATLNVCNTGKANLVVSTITSSNTQFAVTPPSSRFPVVISPDFCFPFQVRATPTSTGPQTTTLTIASNDPANPSVTVQATATSTQPRLATVIANSGNFGNVCIGAFADLNLTISNSGGCDLFVTGISSSSADFQTPQVMSFPLVIHAGNALPVPIRFRPTPIFPQQRTATITVSSNDPTIPSQVVAVSGTVLNPGEPFCALTPPASASR
jgi:hypothetical protein